MTTIESDEKDADRKQEKKGKLRMHAKKYFEIKIKTDFRMRKGFFWEFNKKAKG